MHLRLQLPRPIKKESPNEGTETLLVDKSDIVSYLHIKKESPNEGTETVRIQSYVR